MSKRKNVLIKAMLILFVFVFAFSAVTITDTVTTEAASTKTKAVKAYKNFLKKGSFTTSYGRRYKIKGFTVIDINKDRIPELIIESADERGISVFTYKKGKVRMLSDWIGQVWGSDNGRDYIEYNPSQKALVVQTHGGTGLAGYDLIQYKKGKLHTKLSIYMSCSWWNGKVTRSCGYSKQNGNSRGCSYKTYKKFSKQYFTGKKVKKYYFAKNTVAARNRLR